MTATFMGHRLRFAVESEREIDRIDSFQLEAAFVTEILQAIRPGDVVWDVGANIGVISLVIAKAADVTVHAFEPEPRNYAHLQKNIELNGLGDRVIAHQLALGDHEGEVQLHVSGEVGEGRHSIVGGAIDDETVPVGLTTAARFSAEHAAVPQVLKIDVEGAELDVVAGLVPLLKEQKIRTLCVEVHPQRLAAQGHTEDAFAEQMVAYGYVSATSASRGNEFHQIYRMEVN